MLKIINLTKNNNSPVYVVSCLVQGLKQASSPQLRQYLLLPIAINLVLYSMVFVVGYFYIADLIALLVPDWLSTIKWLQWLIYLLFFVSFTVIGFLFATVLANIIASPLYSVLAAKTWVLITDNTTEIKPPAIKQVICSEIKRLSYLVSRMIPLLLLFFIPIINLIAPLLWLLFGAWCIGLEFMAYPLENQGILFAQQKERAKTQKWTVLSFGGLIMLGMSIPLVNLIVAPVAVIGATIYNYKDLSLR